MNGRSVQPGEETGMEIKSIPVSNLPPVSPVIASPLNPGGFSQLMNNLLAAGQSLPAARVPYPAAGQANNAMELARVPFPIDQEGLTCDALISEYPVEVISDMPAEAKGAEYAQACDDCHVAAGPWDDEDRADELPSHPLSASAPPAERDNGAGYSQASLEALKATSHSAPGGDCFLTNPSAPSIAWQHDGLSPPGAPSAIYSLPMQQIAGTPQWQQTLGKTVIYFVREGVHHAQLRLTPEALGQVTVQLRMGEEQVNIRLIADSAQAKDALENAMPLLRQSLSEAGILLGEGRVELNAGDSASVFSDKDQPKQQQSLKEESQRKQHRENKPHPASGNSMSGMVNTFI